MTGNASIQVVFSWHGLWRGHCKSIQSYSDRSDHLFPMKTYVYPKVSGLFQNESVPILKAQVWILCWLDGFCLRPKKYVWGRQIVAKNLVVCTCHSLIYNVTQCTLVVHLNTAKLEHLFKAVQGILLCVSLECSVLYITYSNEDLGGVFNYVDFSY